MQPSAKAQKVLVTDDDADIREMLLYNLSKEGYEVQAAENGLRALEIAKDFKPQLILLDIMMPGIDGVETCRRLRELPGIKDSFVIFLTARSEEYSEVAAFDAGANDFITKPIKPRALMSRIAAFFRRMSTDRDGATLSFTNLSIDQTGYSITYNGEQVVLPKKEFELLTFLARNAGKVFTRDELLQNIWGTDVYVLARTVDVHVRKVREKIGEGYIFTVKGVGYKFEDAEKA